MNSKTRSKNFILNIAAGYLSQIVVLFLAFFGRRIFVHFLPVEYLGINGLYTNILTVLSLAELGLDSAFVYLLYAPVNDNDSSLIFSLVKYFRKVYSLLAVGIICVGLLLIPLLPYIVNVENNALQLTNTQLSIYYTLFLINTVLPYFTAHYSAVLSATQEIRVQKNISLVSNVLLQLLHIAVLFIWKNYYAYIAATILMTAVQCVSVLVICRRMHGDYLVSENACVEINKKEINKKIKSTILYKFGAIAINNTDNILISILVGTATVGLYSNYYTVTSAIQGFINIISMSLLSGLGNFFVGKQSENRENVFFIQLLVYHGIAAVGGIGFTLLFPELISIWLGKEFLLDSGTTFAIAFNFYLTNSIGPIWVNREANGLFEKVKFLMLIRAGVNLGLSVLFGYLWGTFGILFATSVSLLVTSFWYEPFILFPVVFEKSTKSYWLKQVKYWIATAVSFLLSWGIVRLMPDGIIGMGLKAVIIILITCVSFLVSSLRSGEFRYILNLIQHFLKRKTA